MSVPMASEPPRPATRWCPFGSDLERLSKYTPVKVTKKPQIREIVLTVSVVLKPPKRMNEAQRVAVVNVT